MKKHSPEDSFVLRNNLLLGITVLSFLLFTETYSQIPLGGFCRLREYFTQPGHSKLLSLDYNNDGYRDLLIPDETSNGIIIHQGNSRDAFGAPQFKYFTGGISLFRPFDSERGKINRYAFISRKGKSAGLISFSASGSPVLVKKIKLNSFPSDLDAADIDGDGVRELLISGSAYGGLSVIGFKKNKLSEFSLEKSRLLSGAVFTDLDYDGFADIACYDVLRKSIVFFYNDQSGSFRELRSLALNWNANGFTKADFNSDGLDDFVYATAGGLEALLGDSVSSYSQKAVLNTDVKPDSYVIYDFNGDGFNDVGFINAERESFYVSFARNSRSFYPPVFYFYRPGITEVIAYIDRDGKKAAILSKEGKIYLIDAVRLSDKKNSIAIASAPGVLGLFDFQNDNFWDVCAIDNRNEKLIVLISRGRNLAHAYYSYPVSFPHNKILVDDSERSQKSFYCFSSDRKLIEIITADFDKNSFVKKILYAAGPIVDLRITKNKGEDFKTIVLLVRLNGKIVYQKFQYRDFRYLSSDIKEIDDNAADAAIALNGSPEFYTFFPSDNSVMIRRSILDKENLSRKDFEIKLPDAASGQISGFIKMIKTGRTAEEKPVCIVSAGEQCGIITFGADKTSLLSINNLNLKKEWMYSSYRASEKQNLLYLYDAGLHQILAYVIKNGSKPDFAGAIRNLPEINSFFVADLSRSKKFLVYSGATDNLISFENIE